MLGNGPVRFGGALEKDPLSGRLANVRPRIS
jgi:hypothetical protein